MSQKTFTIMASVIFGVVALFHLLRIFLGWPAVIGGWTVPMWLSWIGLVVRRLELLRNKPGHAWLRQRKQTALHRSRH
jgi:hypothetical protein